MGRRLGCLPEGRALEGPVPQVQTHQVACLTVRPVVFRQSRNLSNHRQG